MKSNRPRLTMIVFLFLLLNFSNSFKKFERDLKSIDESQSISPLQWDQNDYDFENLDKMIIKMKLEQDFLDNYFDSYSKIFDSLDECEDDENSLAYGFKLIKDEFNTAKEKLNELSLYIKNVNIQLLNGKKEDKLGFREYRKHSKERRKNGVNLVNQLMRQFLFTEKTKMTMKRIEKLFSKLPHILPKQTGLSKIMNSNIAKNLKEGLSKTVGPHLEGAINKVKSMKWRKKKFRVESEASQFSKMRIWSSFRLDEIVNHIYIDEAQGEDVIRAAMISMMSAVPAHYCWVHDSRLALPDVVCPSNMKRIGSICYEQCDDGQTRLAGLCLSKCANSYMDCNFFCSKSNCENPQDFVLKKYKKTEFLMNPSCPKGYKKNGNLCYPVCEEIGYVTCSDRTCALNKNYCKDGKSILETGVLKAFIEFLGHIYTVKSDKKFGWSNPEGLERAKDIMGLKYSWNLTEIKRIVSQAVRISLNGDSVSRKNYEKNVEKIGSSFFKTKDNKPLTLIFKWADFTKIVGEFLNKWASRFIKGQGSSSNDAENWEVCKMTNFSTKCFENFQRFIVNMTPYYIYDVIGYISKPICAFELNEVLY
jgi:hypothetical protein